MKWVVKRDEQELVMVPKRATIDKRLASSVVGTVSGHLSSNDQLR